MLKASIDLIKDLKKQKRNNSSLLFLDNIKIIKDAISQGLTPKCILVVDEKLNEWDGYPVFKVDRKVIESLSDTKTPQGVVCVTEYTQYMPQKPISNFLVLDHLQDPGNVGTLIRTATACGFNSVFLVDSVSVGNSKLVRSSVGTIFQNHVYSLTQEEFISKVKEWNLPLLKADMNGNNIFNMNFNGLVGVVIGNEGQGVCEKISSLCSISVKIPMSEGVESLNAAVSGSIIMYEIAKNNLK